MSYDPKKKKEETQAPQTVPQASAPEAQMPTVDTVSQPAAAEEYSENQYTPTETRGNSGPYSAYTPSATAQKAQTELQNHIDTGVAPYNSDWNAEIDSIVDKIMNRGEFSYDVNSDALYQQYADTYRRNAELVAEDTTGRAAAMTGGYGNSWASTVGASAYASEMQKLNDRIPELYQLALDKYNAEGDAMYQQYGLLADREATDYSRYRDEVADYNTKRDYLAGRYDAERQFDYGVHRDTVADERYEDEWALNEGMTYAEYGDFGKLQDLGVDTSAAEELYGLEVEGKQLENEGAIFSNAYDKYTGIGDTSKLEELGYNTEQLDALWQSKVDTTLKMSGLELESTVLNLVTNYAAIGNFDAIRSLGVPESVVSQLETDYAEMQAHEATVRNQEIVKNNYVINDAAYNAAVNKYNTSGDATVLDEYYGLEPGTTQKHFDAQAEAASAAEGKSLTMDDIDYIGGYAEDAKVAGRSPDDVVESIVNGMGLTAQAMSSVEQIVYGAYGYELVMVEIDANGDPIYAWKPKNAIKTADVTETEVNMWNNGRNYPKGH